MDAIVITQFGGLDALEYRSVNDPAPNDTQVLIQVAARSVNFADIKAREGRYHGAGKPPFVPGLDVTGTVVQIGSKVTGFSVGDRVVAFPINGSYSEFAVSDEILTYRLPETIDFQTAAAFPTVAVTAYEILHKVGRIEQGETVVIHSAAGGVGTTAIQLAKHFGAGQVIGVVSTDEKVNVALKTGADYAINYSKEDFAERVNELTGGKGADLILDPVSGDIFKQEFDCLADFGRIVMFGHAALKPGTFTTTTLHSKCRSVLGYSMGTTRAYRPHVLKDSVYAVMELIESGELNIVVGKTYPLKEAAAAQSWIESRQSFGKVVLL